MSETFDKFKILFLVDVNQGKCDHDVKVLANRISLSAFRILTALDVVPESIQLVETAIHKLHGSLIPVDTLVQTNRQCVVNVFSSLLSLKEAGPPGTKGSPSLMGLISYTSVLEYHLKQQQVKQQQPKLSSANAGPSCTKCHLMSSENSIMCSFSITPTKVSTHMSRSPKKHRNNKTKETQTIHAQSLLSNESCNLSLYGVLPLEDAGFLQFKCEQDYMCSSEPNSGDPGDSVPFLSLIEKLIKSSLALILVTESSPVLYILRPLTSESATLSGLCLGETLGLEKRLGEASKESSPKKRTPTVENKPWDQLIARAIQHKSQSSGTSTHHKNNPCFDPNVLGKTHLPGCRQGLVSLIEKLNDRISQLEFLNEDEVQSLRELQRVYRQENKPIRPRETVQSPAKECENMMMNGPKPEPPTTETLPSRGVLMLESFFTLPPQERKFVPREQKKLQALLNSVEPVQDTTLLVHFFGSKGRDVLKYEDFHSFMENLQSEVIELEFLEFSRGLATISEEDFARILLRYTMLDSSNIEECIKRVRSRTPSEKGVSFEEFRKFCQFLNTLDDFSIAMKMYTYADQAVSKDFAIDPLISRSHLMHTQDKWTAFKYCIKNEMRTYH
uniref:EF-hand domain-containing family member A2 n=1 Tax=Magallana gigas TaxID=29159 RepID=K1R8A2_MAGGI